MKSLIALIQVILIDLGMRCDTSTSRDFKTISVRIKHEGISFITISLANFGSDFQKSLDQGFVGSDQFVGFKRTGGLPRFLGGFLDLVFDRKTGRLLECPSVTAIQAIRQITLMFSKILLECTDARKKDALKKFIECEQDVRQSDRDLSPETLKAFHRMGTILWASFFSKVDGRLYDDLVMPRHGPGATADKLRGNAKYKNLTWTRRLEEIFPHWEYLIPSERWIDRVDRVNILEPRDEIPVKVTLVPKTLKTPRIIAIEPTCMQYMQQGILDIMVDEMSRFDNTRVLVSSESQEPNQRLARQGSITGALATLDLSEASDRVSNQHVRLLLSNYRWLRSAVDATRSRKADVPGHGVIRLAKFASMGSALCFPIESLVFMTIVFVGIERGLNRQLTKKDVKSFFGQVRTYGDDIIVPVKYVESVIGALEDFGLRVNRKKSFWTGRFRESCGSDYYDGHDVSIVRLRNLLPNSRRDVSQLASAVSLRNQMFDLVMPRTVDFLDRWIEKIIPFPYVERTSPVLGRNDYYLPSQEIRHCSKYQVPLVKGAVLVPRLPLSELDDYGALMKWFLKNGDKPFQNRDHLRYSGRPVSVRIKTRWAPLR